MSKIITTEIGRFRCVDDHGVKSFLFECPECNEWLPMSEEHLNGSLAPIHFARIEQMPSMTHGRVCSFAEKKAYGATLIATMQARILMCEDVTDLAAEFGDS